MADHGEEMGMKPDVLLVGTMMPALEARLDEAFTVHRLAQAKNREAFLAEVGPRVRGIVTGGVTGASRSLMEVLPALEIVAVNGIGTDAVDLDYARVHGIRVTTTPDVLTDDVADMAMALLLATARQICWGDRYVRAGLWGRQGLPLGRKVSGSRLGILGLGRIGRAIAHRAEGFGMEIAYTDVAEISDVSYRRIPSLIDLAGWADILVIAASGGLQSHGIVDATVLDAIGPEGMLVNVARGSIIDEAALVTALLEKRLGAAGLDVFVDEPQVPEALWGLDHVVLQPHRASATLETRIAMGDLVLSNLAAHFAGRQPPTAVV
jgi:lactate dehydrogenase-like 2-hydroxyacid dehydrogenase